jgi:hypothetical protein
MKTTTISGTYGRAKTPCEIFVAENRDGSSWYAVEDSQNVNLTCDELADGVDIEELTDVDSFTWPKGIESEEALIEAIEA